MQQTAFTPLNSRISTLSIQRIRSKFVLNKIIMNQEVTAYIEKLPEWQIKVCDTLRKMIYKTIPNVEERMQYGKPHYLKNGHYACVVHAAKDKISFMIFNAGELEEIKGFFKSMSSPDRKTASILKDQAVDYKQLADLLKQASKSL